MIYISTAMHMEAKWFISTLKLKKVNESTRFQIFKNDNIVLVVSGVGMMASAMATTYILTKYKAKSDDLFINIGVCGSKDENVPIATTILCNKIINHDTKKCFYPDILFKHPFYEGTLESFSSVVDENLKYRIQGEFVDMEGAASYEAAALFLQPQQINIIKIVSDALKSENLTPKKVEELIKLNANTICEWVKKIYEIHDEKEELFLQKEKDCIESVREKLRLTVSMYYELIKLARHYKLRIGDIEEIIKPFLQIECKSKNEGKRHFAELKERFMEF